MNPDDLSCAPIVVGIVDDVLHQAFAFALTTSIFQVVVAMAFLASHQLLVACIPVEGIVGASILVDAVWTLAVVGYEPVEVGVPDDDAIVGSKSSGIGILLFCGDGDGDVFSLGIVIIGGGENVPNAVLIGGADESVGAETIECHL